MTNDEAKEMALDLLKSARKNLESDGNLMPIMVVAGCDPSILFGPSFRSFEEKRAVYSAIEKLVTNTPGVTHCITINDSYYKRTEPTDHAALDRMEQHGVSEEPDRQEAIIAMISPRDSDDFLAIQHYHRDGDNIVWDGDLVMEPGVTLENRPLPPIWKLAPAVRDALAEAVDAK